MQLEGHRMGKMRPGDYIECEHRYGTNLGDPICIHQFIDEKLTVHIHPHERTDYLQHSTDCLICQIKEIMKLRSRMQPSLSSAEMIAETA